MFDALKLMAENDIGSLVVLEDDKLVGIITERHYAREIVLKAKASCPAPPQRMYGNTTRIGYPSALLPLPVV